MATGSRNGVESALGFKVQATTASEYPFMQEGVDDVGFYNNAGSPEGVVSANKGSICMDRTNGVPYYKQTGTGDTGWVQIGDEINDYHDSRYIVSPGGAADGANYTSIGAAITAAVLEGGVQNIAIQPATYTEDPTVPAGINLVCYGGYSNSSVIIKGKVTCTDAGRRTLQGIRLETNADYALVISGSAASVVNLIDCDLNGADNSVVNMTSSGSPVLNIINCSGDLATTGINYITKSGNGTFRFVGGNYLNTGLSVTPNSITDGSFEMFNTSFSHIFDLGVNSDGFNCYNCQFNAGLTAVPIFTQASSGPSPQGTLFNCFLGVGNTSAIHLVASSMRVINTTITSAGTNAIDETGASTIVYAGLTLGGSGTGIAVTTQTKIPEGPSRTIGGTNSGVVNTLLVQNLSNTASSGANVAASVGGSSAADPTHQAIVSGVTTWTWGADNDGGDDWVLSASGALGTNDVMRVATTGEISFPLQSAFYGQLTTNAIDVTGDNTSVYMGGQTAALTEIYDRNGDFTVGDGSGVAATYTCPVSGNVNLIFNILLQQLISVANATLEIVTSNRTYRYGNTGTSFTGNQPLAMAALADMDAGDTAIFNVTVSNMTKIVDIYGPNTTDCRTFVQGWRLG